MRAVVGVLTAAVFWASTALASETVLAGWFDLPVPGGTATLAGLGIPREERALTLSLLARAVDERGPSAAAFAAAAEAEPVTVPAPLSADAWRRLLPELPNQPDAPLFTRLVSDRSALLVATALSATDDSMRALVARDRDLLRFLYREAPGPFVVAARSLRLDGARVAVPGGEGADAIWEALAGASPLRPGEFIRALLLKDAGRLAWYFDTIASLDAPRLAAAWPADGEGGRLGAARSLYEPFRDSDAQTRFSDQPFRRGVADPWLVVMLSDLDGAALAGPSWQPMWQMLFAQNGVTRGAAARLTQDALPKASLPWITREIVMTSSRERRDRFEMFRLAQRVFPTATPADLPDIAVAISGYRRYSALLLALERMEISTPATWAAAVDAARHVDEHAGSDRVVLASFQGIVALLERMRHLRTIDAPTAERLIRSLGEAVRSDDPVVPAIMRWVSTTFVAALPPLERPDAWTTKTAYESTILQALWGARPPAPRVLAWEGLTYRIDRADAERERLRALRSILPSPGLDAAIAGEDRRAFADAITVLVYCTALGDPEGPASLSREIAQRHDFGLRSAAIVRQLRPWAPPEERQGLGAWHIQGSLIGLDLGLSRLALRRVADGQMPAKPVLTLNDLGTLTRTVVALVAGELRDDDRDELVAAVDRGRRRVAAAEGDSAALQALAREARLSAIARETLPWVATRQPDTISQVFSHGDLLWLGRPAVPSERLARWGLSGDGMDGRRVTMFPMPSPWEDWAGRADLGQISTRVPDLTLRLAEETARLGVPAELVPALLAFAVDDYWHETQARFSDDWPRMVGQAAALEPARVEDYVAALTGAGPLRAQ
jgi:hypothetical protein